MLNLPEIKKLIPISRDYINGKVSISELNGEVSECLNYSIALGIDKEIQNLLGEYHNLINKAWNEWGGFHESNFTEENLKKWISEIFLDDDDESYQSFKSSSALT